MPDSNDKNLDKFQVSTNLPISWPKRAANQTSVSPGDSDQFLRKITLVVSDSTSGGNDLNFTPDGQPQLRVVFRIEKATTQSPNLFTARIYNLQPSTQAKVIEYSKVILSAGYQKGRYGKIFEGTVVQYRQGKENATDTYLEIIAGDGDLSYRYDVAALQFDPGATHTQVINSIITQAKGSGQQIVPGSINIGDFGDQTLLRSYSTMGMIHELLRDWGNAANADWFIDDGKLNFISRQKYVAGATIELTPSTGLIGLPEVTPTGIQVRCLLNPYLTLGGLIKVSTDVLSGVPFLPGSQTKLPISQEERPAGVAQPIYTQGQQLSSAFTSPTGTYKILLLEHSGDTRGNPWYTDMVCVALDAAGKAIHSTDLPYGRTRVTGFDNAPPPTAPVIGSGGQPT